MQSGMHSDFGSLVISVDVELSLSMFPLILARRVMEIPLPESGHYRINSMKHYCSKKYSEASPQILCTGFWIKQRVHSWYTVVVTRTENLLAWF